MASMGCGLFGARATCIPDQFGGGWGGAVCGVDPGLAEGGVMCSASWALRTWLVCVCHLGQLGPRGSTGGQVMGLCGLNPACRMYL